MNNNWWVWLVVIAVVVGGGWLVLKGGNTTNETGPIKLGFIGPLTGDAASLGTVARSAVELAVEEINASGGVDGRMLEVVAEDGECTAGPATSAASKLINADGVEAIIGGLCSSETAAFAPAAMQAKVVTLSYCSSAPPLSQTGKYFFRDYPSDANQGKFAAEYAYNTLGVRKVAVVYHISDWGTGIKNVFVERFKALGGEIVVEEGSLQTNRDYRTSIQKVQTAAPDYIYAALYPEGGIAFLQQAKEVNVTTKILGGDAWGDTKLQAEAAALDILYVEPKSSWPDDFKTKLLAKAGGEQVPVCSANAYDAVYIMAAAMEKAGTSDSDKLADALRATKYNGVSGRIEFDANGDVTVADYVVKRIANGSSTVVE